MDVVLNSPNRTLASLMRNELLILNNALNEVCNGIHFSDDEF